MKKYFIGTTLLLGSLISVAQEKNSGLSFRTNGITVELGYEAAINSSNSILITTGLGPTLFNSRSNFGGTRQSGSFELLNIAWSANVGLEYRKYFSKKTPQSDGMFVSALMRFNMRESDWLSNRHYTEMIDGTIKFGPTFGFKKHFSKSPIYIESKVGLGLLTNYSFTAAEPWPIFDAKIGILLWRR